MLSIIVLACYLACAAWFASSVGRAGDSAAHGRRIAGLALAAVAAALHAVLLWRTAFATAPLALSATEMGSLVGLAMGLIGLGLAWARPRFVALSAVLVTIAGLAAMAGTAGRAGFALERHNWEMAAHILLSTVAYAVIAVAAVLVIALALLDRRLRQRRPLGWLAGLPSLEALDAATFQALGAGFALLTLALFSGFIFVEDLFGQHLIHKTVLSCLAWIVFAVLLFGRWRFGWRGRTATSWTLSGFALLALAYFGSKIVLESILGRHWT